MTKQILGKLLKSSQSRKSGYQKAARLKSRQLDNSSISLANGAFAQTL